MTVEVYGQSAPSPVEVGEAAPAARFVAISSLSVHHQNDAQVVISSGWNRTAAGTFIANSPKNAILLKLRSATLIYPVLSSSKLSTVNADGTLLGPRLGYFAGRYFTDDTSRGSMTYFRPQAQAANAGSCGFHGLDGTTRFFEFIPNGPGDGDNCTPALASMTVPADDVDAEFGMFWELIGFIVNDDAVFDLVDVSQLIIEIDEHGDSNDGGYTAPTSGGASYSLRQARTGLVTEAISNESFAPAGARVQWIQQFFDAYFSARNLAQDIRGNVHGGSWQGTMGAATRAYIESTLWAGAYQDLIDRRNNVFHDDTEVTSGSHWTGGTRRPKLVTIGSFVNDSIRALLEYFGSTFPIDSAFRGATHQASVKALLDAITAEFPEAKILVHTGVYTDLGLGSSAGVPYVDTNQRTEDACCAGSPNGRAFQNNGTSGSEGTTGLYLPLSDFSAQTGISTTINLGSVHFTEAQHTAIKNAVNSVFSTWLDAALGIVYVNSATGNNANAGTFAAPKATISGAGSSWTYLALSGTFAETITVSASGTQYAPKTIFRYGSTASVTAINTNSKNHVLVHGVTATGSTGFTIAAGTGIRLSHVTASGCSTAGAAISGGTVVVEYSSFSACGIGLNLSGAAAVTGRRNTYSGNTNGVKTAGAATLVDDRSHLYESAGHGYHVTAGTVTLTNCKLGTKVNAVGVFDTWAAVWVEGGQANIYNSIFAIVNGTDFLSGGSIAYAIRATGSGLVQYKNNVFTANSNVYSTYVWADTVGASGNIVAAVGNVYEDIGIAFKFATGVSLGGAIPRDYATWRAFLDRSGNVIGVDGAYGATLVAADGESDIVDDKPGTTSIANGIGANLAATFTRDYFRVTRPSSGAWDAGPWII